MPYVKRVDRKTKKELNILIDTGATACYIRKGIYENKNKLPIYKKVSTVHGYSIIKYYHYINIFETRHLFYEIEGLESDLLIGINLIRKIGAIINTEKGVLEYKGKTEKLIYHDSEENDEISLIETKNTLPLKEFILKKYFADRGCKNTDSLLVESSEKSLGSTNPEHADDDITVNKKVSFLGSTNPEYPDVELSVNKKLEKVGTRGSNRDKINNTHIANENRVEFLEREIINKIEEEHSKINLQIPFRTDIRGEINTLNDRAIYSKQYPYALSVSDFVINEINRMLNDQIIRPSRSPYNSPVLVVPKKGQNEDGTPKHRLVIDYKKLNENTIPDRYPMQDPSVILANLGKAKYFSTIDLESGFHQILMKDSDIEKTAFSINNGKFEFLRMPFGLTNAPRIFQRAMDDILREQVGKTCHVYMDDIIIFSNSIEQHYADLIKIINILQNANMKISLEKSKFFKLETAFLGYMVSYNVIKTDPEKISTISNYPIPRNIRQLRSFLGLTGYYRKFVRNYAKIAKPLTKYLGGENGKVSKRMSTKISIQFDESAVQAFNELKENLISQIELVQPDYNKKFVLTTDASDVAIGAVLSQDEKPITFISKTLNKTEQLYATNKKELLAIVWALKTLRNYLYGVNGIEILTDHQSLSFTISDKNPNVDMKKWYSFIESFTPKIKYKPGTTNVVADALSRIQINNITNSDINESEQSNSDQDTQHSAESSFENVIQETRKPLNQFKQQLLLTKGRYTIHESLVVFGKTRHIIEYDTVENLVTILREYLPPNITVGIHCSLEDLYHIQVSFRNSFTNKFLFTRIFLQDVENTEDKAIIIEETHSRAHRGLDENYKQISKLYYWPNLYKKLKEYIKNCKICNENKYNRHPIKIPIGESPIPTKEGENLHIDIYYAQSLTFITCIDAYSKFLVVKEIQNKLNIENKVMELIQQFPQAKVLMTDNEPSFTSAQFKSFAQRCGLTLHYADPRHSTSNGQVERAHSTLTELARCIKEEFNLIDYS